MRGSFMKRGYLQVNVCRFLHIIHFCKQFTVNEWNETLFNAKFQFRSNVFNSSSHCVVCVLLFKRTFFLVLSVHNYFYKHTLSSTFFYNAN